MATSSSETVRYLPTRSGTSPYRNGLAGRQGTKQQARSQPNKDADRRRGDSGQYQKDEDRHQNTSKSQMLPRRVSPRPAERIWPLHSTSQIVYPDDSVIPSVRRRLGHRAPVTSRTAEIIIQSISSWSPTTNAVMKTKKRPALSVQRIQLMRVSLPWGALLLCRDGRSPQCVWDDDS
jgi:hypothetical protein